MIHRIVILAQLSLLATFAGPARAEMLVALIEPTVGQQCLYSFNSQTLAAGTSVTVSGLGAGERLLAIDFRPLTGQLYGLSSGSSLYTLNTQSGAASKVGTGFTTALDGGNFGFDFNPVIDRIRIVSDADQNLVAHPDTGAANIATTTPVFYGPADPNSAAQPNVVHHAYDGNVLGALAPATQLRAIDTNLDILVTQANNAGTLGTIGPLGINAEDIGGFDVATTGRAFSALSDGVGSVTSTLYSINLSTGAATSLGAIPQTVWGLAAVPVPEPSALVLVSLASLLCNCVRNRRLMG
jgi:hypothetical protein